MREPSMAWFLGPKSENVDILEQSLSTVLDGYAEWRRNYHPNDGVLLTQADLRAMQPSADGFGDAVTEMMAALRRTFPFHSPRYLAHMQSDTTLASIVGNFAGTLFNPNNVTPESGAVTVGWEIDACAALLTMLGYQPAPEPPTTPDAEASYAEAVAAGFGWAHLTSGGTGANIEALWAARTVTYFPLAARHAAKKLNLSVQVTLPGREKSGAPRRASLTDKSLDKYELLLMQPKEKIGLFVALIKAARTVFPDETPAAVAKLVVDQLNSKKAGPASGFAAASTRYPPVIFASEAAHYSVKKAADVLGLGSKCVRAVGTDAMFRIRVDELEQALQECRVARQVPVAVLGILGTTEEGAVDPVHEIVRLRRRLENTLHMSFWLHVDAAWGGYFRSLLNLTDRARTTASALRTATELGVPLDHDPLGRQLDTNVLDQNDDDGLDSRVGYLAGIEGEVAADRDPVQYVPRSVTDSVLLESGRYFKDLQLIYGEDPAVIRSLAAVPEADSVTVDPHKMGYVGYPCGVVAFRDDWIRHFLKQDAQYITAVMQDLLANHPPRHGEPPRWPEPRRIKIDAFAPFTLEGSRPGASAAALWLSSKVTPPDIQHHGRLVAASVIAARELYEWLGRWDDIATANGQTPQFEIVRYTPGPPDTNVVIFGVKPRGSDRLTELNWLTDAVYQRFAIRQEFGEDEYPYGQSFFLSNTDFKHTQYSTSSVADLLTRARVGQAGQVPESDYTEHGIKVLRAAVMNPYIVALRRTRRQYVMQEFLSALHDSAEQNLQRRGAAGQIAAELEGK